VREPDQLGNEWAGAFRVPGLDEAKVEIAQVHDGLDRRIFQGSFRGLFRESRQCWRNSYRTRGVRLGDYYFFTP
jgi:hypothetical protein